LPFCAEVHRFLSSKNELKTQNPDIALIIKILLAQGLVEVLRHLP
jgi:hypothetical protein